MARNFDHSKRRILLGGAALAATLASGSIAEAGTDLVLIVHRENTQRLSAVDIANIFRTTRRHWPGGETIVAFNLAPGSSERVNFDRVALGLEPDAASRYWIDRKIRGGQPPPRVVPNSLLVARLVAELRGGVGYAPEALLPQGVRVVARVRGPAIVMAGASRHDLEQL